MTTENKLSATDPSKVCGDIWFNGTEEQRKGFGKGTEGRGRDEHPPKEWWGECIRKVSESGSINSKTTDKFAEIDGNYVAIKNDNGKWTIKDVPIFAEVNDKNTKLRKKVPIDVLKRLIDKAQLRAKENYYPPLHINHHDDGKDVFQVGFFIPTKLSMATYNGEATTVILADLIDISDDIYSLIRQNKFPYRSVELYGLEAGDPEITGLALLEHETPFFRLPLLTIKKEIYDNPEKQFSFDEDYPIKAFQGVDDKYCKVLFSLKGGKINMANEPEKKDDEKKDEKEDEKKDEKNLQEMTSDEKIAAIYDMLKEIVDLLKKGVSEQEEKEPEEQKESGPVDLKEGEKNEKGEIYKLEGKITALQDRLNKRDKKDEDKTIIEKAKKDLVKYSIKDIDNRLESIIKKGGKEGVEHFVIGVKENASIEPPDTFDRFAQSEEFAQDKDLMIYVGQGPEKYALAIKAAKQYEIIKRDNPNISRPTFIEKYMAQGDGKEAVVEIL